MKDQITSIISKALKKINANLKPEEINSLIEIPPSSEMGDFAFPCFILSKQLKKSPHDIAIEIREHLNNPQEFQDIQTSGPYINFFVDRNILAKKTVQEIQKQKDKYGKNNSSREKIMVEFSQANTHKAFHVGHIRGTSIGESLSRILEFSGNKIIRANYQGDTGMHVAKWIWCYQKYHSNEKLKSDEAWIASIYVDAVQKLENNEKLQEEVNEINKKLDEKSDKKLNEIWKKTRQLSLDSLEKIYQDLNTKFDKYYFEADFEKPGKELINELVKKGIAEKSEGAIIANLEKYNLGVSVLLRSDGTILYAGKDIALAKQKFKDFKLDKALYIIADEQNLHMQQVFKILELDKFKSENLKHVSYGLVRLPHGKMSSRTGDNILYSDFKKELVDFAKNEIKKRTPKISAKDLEDRALKVSIAAIKYSMLKQGSNRTIVFDKKEALNFEGDTGAYILYSYARASSILRKVRSKSNLKIKKLEQKEIELIKKLSSFPEIVLESSKNLNPAVIANYSYQLSQNFNEFYHACPVLNSEQEGFRLSLVNSFRQVLKNSLNLLGIETLEEM